MLLKQFAALEFRRAHLDAERFGFFGAGDDAAVIVRENNNRSQAQLWPEGALA